MRPSHGTPRPVWRLYAQWGPAMILKKLYTLGVGGAMQRTLCRLAILVLLCSGSVFALICQQSREDWQRWVKQGEPYSTAACDGLDPRGHFEEKKAELEQASTETIKLMLLAGVAKAR
jgi:hypothetical protein